MNFHIMTLFPEMIEHGLNTSITGRAAAAGLISFEAVNIRDYTDDPHGHVDDYPYGGGAGMVMQVQPIYECYRDIVHRIMARKSASKDNGQTACEQSGKSLPEPSANKAAEVYMPEPPANKAAEAHMPDPPAGENIAAPCSENNAHDNENNNEINIEPNDQRSGIRVIYMSPAGSVFNQEKARELAQYEDLIILCGHYEGVDERAIELIVDEEISIGDYVLTGGELAAMVVVDAASRMVKGVLTNEDSGMDESFSDGLLEYPQYTRPKEFMGMEVPDILLSGHHANIEKWRHEQSLKRTSERRPDLLKDM